LPGTTQNIFVMAGNNKGDFEIKGFHIDLRDEVMTMEGLKKTAYELSQMGLNTLIMELLFPAITNGIKRYKTIKNILFISIPYFNKY